MTAIRQTTARELSHDDILGVVEGRHLAVHIPGFVHKESLASARAQLLDHPDRGGLSQAEEFKRIGFAYSEISDEASRERYHTEARGNIHRLRDLFAPYASPSDVLRLLLEETWQPGANLLHIDGRKAFIGICRYQDRDVDLNPHTDALERNLPPGYSAGLTAQLSVNIYLNIPEQGGELELWGTEPGEEVYDGLKGDRTWGIDRDRIGPPVEVIKPSAGDLLLLNPRQIHAVRPSGDEPRITLGHFLGYYGPDRPLALWS
ncbi:2OG-Fe(II)-dependent halogenase WelO5 family protein [Streptomyces sclerotialus]|uniref:2OG-Fe(II)-dependent halogenase WelO5 family protein n=1 Tax=Streptomyces sclerotialus TaxID=1957 RepID=UPI0004C7E03E